MSAPGQNPSPDDLKKALKAFKKRLKLTRLENDSKLGGGPLSGGKTSEIVAITPPKEFPWPVWEELIRQKKLKAAGQGLYELIE